MRGQRAADCREEDFRQVDGTDTYKSCGKWEIGIGRSQIQGERGEWSDVNSQEMQV